ncbi:MAG: hypothetical protein ACI4OR_04425 [Alphaproteobacteria bacterium]
MSRISKAILWVVCYGGACWIGIKAKLGFDILSTSHWSMLFDKSVHSIWPPEMASKKVVCKVSLAFIIVGILGLSVVIKKKKPRIPIVKGELPEKGSMRPALMPSQGKMNVGPTPTQIAATGSAPAPSANSMAEVLRQITEIAKTFEVSVFPHVKLENTFTQLVVSDDATALLLKILPQSAMWQVEQAATAEESLWKIEGEEAKPLLKEIMQSTAILSRLEPEATSISVIILAGGTLQNPAEVRQYLGQQGIRIASLQEGSMPDIPSWRELLAEFYPLKESEEQNETNIDSQSL